MAISNYTVETSVEALADRLTKSFQDTIERAIKEALMKQAEVIVTQIAKDMAKSLHGRVSTYRDAADGLKVSLIINGVSQNIPK
jgi:hypothetical protein